MSPDLQDAVWRNTNATVISNTENIRKAAVEELSGRVRCWVRAVAYAEDDFVVDAEDVKELLDLVDPEWRRAFDER